MTHILKGTLIRVKFLLPLQIFYLFYHDTTLVFSQWDHLSMTIALSSRVSSRLQDGITDYEVALIIMPNS